MNRTLASHSPEVPRSDLELQVQAQCRNQDGAAIAIVAGIHDVLESEGRVGATPGVQRVIGFDDIFAAIVEAPVPEKKTEAAESKVLLMVARESVGDESYASAIEFPVPAYTAGAKAN